MAEVGLALIVPDAAPGLKEALIAQNERRPRPQPLCFRFASWLPCGGRGL